MNNKETITKQIKTFITDVGVEISKLNDRNFSNELDKKFDSKKLDSKKEIYDQVLVDLTKSTDLNTFLLHQIEKAEKEIEKATEERKDLRTKIESGASIDHEKNGEINGNMVAWNEILHMCIDGMSAGAAEDQKARSKK
jgi:phage-related minor tail protein